MRILDWNVGKFGSDDRPVCEAIRSNVGDGEWVATLQEVRKSRFAALREVFGNEVDMTYSLTYREPGPFDSGGRKLGCAILASGGLKIDRSGVFERSLLPERTLWARISGEKGQFTVATMHALTGSAHRVANASPLSIPGERASSRPTAMKGEIIVST